MERTRRRTLLAGISLAGTVGVAGCSLRGQRESTPADTPTATLDDLSFAAEVVAQRTTDAPASLRAALANEGEGPCRIGTGETIVPSYETGPGDDVLLLPGTDVGPNDRPDELIDGCWRYTDDHLLTRDIVEWRELAPGDSLEETYDLLTRGEEGPCLPAGEYRFADTIQRPNGDAELIVRVDVSIAEGGVAAQGSAERS